MSLVSTLGKVAMGVMLAKGVGKMVGGSQGGGGGLGGLLGSLGGQAQSAGGGLGDLLGKVTGGQSGGGLGDLLGKVTGGNGGGSLGGLGNILGSLKEGGSAGGGLGGLAGMLGGAGASAEAGGLGGLLDSLGAGGAGNSGLGGLLNSALQGEQVDATPDQEQQAEIMLRAMINAAKADGEIDAKEQQQIAEHLDDITPEEVALVQQIMSEPLDLNALVQQIPAGMEQQAYFMSLLAIDLDHQAEAQYLQNLAQGLNLSPQVCNAIHEKLGAPTLFA